MANLHATSHIQDRCKTFKKTHMEIKQFTPLRIPNQRLLANNFEVWSNGEIIDKGDEELELWVEQMNTENLDKAIQITVRKRDKTVGKIHKYIKERFYLDVAFATNDRILVCIIPNDSNVKDYNSFESFVAFAPLKTRKYYNFISKEPYCCSLFFDDNDKLYKISYSNNIDKTQIICNF